MTQLLYSFSYIDAPEYSGRAEYQVNEGARDFRIQLTLDSSPIPSGGNFSWFFNDQLLTDGQDGVVLGVNFIQIGSVSRGNAGSYRVLSSNIAGSSEFIFQLVVNCKLLTQIILLSLPLFYIEHTDQPRYSGEAIYNVHEGSQNIRIELVLDSSPIPDDTNFSWFFEDQMLVDGEDGITFGVDFIQFRSVSRVNAGSYRVMSSNAAGSGDFSFQLRVNCK